MYLILLWTAKIIQFFTRLFGNSGAALPGLIIEKVYPRFLKKGLSKIPEGVVVISGTNGKTTTTKLVSESFTILGHKVLTNSTGSNMTRGLISMVVGKSTWTGKLPYDIAAIEVDEAYASVLAKKIPIRAAVVLNVMRDQLDRFGEIDKTSALLGNLTKAATELVVLNGYDNRVSKLSSTHGIKRLYFGVDEKLSSRLKTDDEWHGMTNYSRQIESQSQVVLKSSIANKLELFIEGQTLEIHSKFQGIHNHLNIAAAFTLITGLETNLSQVEIVSAISTVWPAFGRSEVIEIGNAQIILLLVKNPSSFVQTVYASEINKYDTVTVVINDAYADSRDVSWLWDVDVSEFKSSKKLYTSGSRALDMAVRFKYEEIPVAKVLSDPKELISSLKELNGTHAVFCTYTAMLSLRKALVRQGHVEQIV